MLTFQLIWPAFKSYLSKTFSTCFCILFFICFSGHGQYSETLYGTKEGLSHPIVLDIEEDEDGFIWVFTSFGLNRFDGYGFREYMAGDSSNNRRITAAGCLLKDTQGRIWVESPLPALHLIDVGMDRLQQIVLPRLRHVYRDLEEDDQGNLIFTNQRSILRVKESPGMKFEFEELQIPAEAFVVKHLLRLNDGSFLAASFYGMFRLRFSADSLVAEKIRFRDDRNEGSTTYMNTRMLSVDGKVYLLTGNEILKTNVPVDDPFTDTIYSATPLNLHFPQIGLENGQPLYAVVKGGEDELFIRAPKGIYSYHLKSEMVKRIQIEMFGSADNAKGKFRKALYYSSKGILWAGSSRGLLKIVIGNKPFHTILPGSGKSNGLSTISTKGVLIDKNNDLWIGTTADGLYRYGRDLDGTYRKKNHFLPDTRDPNSLAGTFVNTISEDSQNRLWVGTDEVQWMDLSSPGKFYTTKASRYAAQLGMALAPTQFIEDSLGHILILNFTGLNWLLESDLSEAYALLKDSAGYPFLGPHMELSDDKQLYLYNRFYFYKLSGGWTKRICHSVTYPKGYWWEKYAGWTHTPVAYPYELVELFTLDSIYPWKAYFTLSESETGIEVWITLREQKGILRANLSRLEKSDTGSIITTSDFNFIPSGEEGRLEQDYGILEDKKGRIWTTSRDGLFCYDPETEKSSYYYMDDGLAANKFNRGECLDDEGIIYLCTSNGLVYFDPDSISPDPAPEVILTDFRLFHESVSPGPGSVLPGSISKVKKLKLGHRENFIGIGFTSLDYRNTNKIQFRYMMEGLDEDWILSGNNRQAEYTDLRPGNYTFKVIAANGNGVWSRKGTTLGIRIMPPVWFRWWAIMIEVFLFAVGLLFIIRYREKGLKQRAILLEKKVDEKTREVLEQRKEVDELKSRFYANISHEFRTPLTLMIGPLEDSIKRRDDPVSLDKKILGIMLRNARRLLRLINQMLDISKLESGNMQLNLVRADLSDFIRTVSSSFLSLAESRHIEYHIRVNDSPGSTCFDADKVEKVITNLLSNAFKFSGKGDSVGIYLEYIESRDIPGKVSARLNIVDTGRGIEEEKLQHIFERFYQVSDSDTSEEEGTGIGLALTREMVELMKGEIEVESSAGSGTTFTVLFPVSEACFTESQISELQMEVSAPFEVDMDKGSVDSNIQAASDHDSRRLILVVEDNADLRDYIRMQLEPEYRVVEAKNGKKGQEKANIMQPALVITDLMMPEMGGIELCRNLKAHHATDHIPVIMLTAKADMESKLKGLKTGADDYLIKPFDTLELRTRVRNLIEQREKLRERFREIFLNDEEMSGSHAQINMLRGIIEVTKRYLDDPEFDVIRLAGEMAFSRSQLYKKVHGVAGTTPNELIRMIRMKEAARLLRKGDLNVTQVMYQVGMKNTSHFARTFRKFYAVNPGEYVKKQLS